MICDGKRGKIANTVSELCGKDLTAVSRKRERFTGKYLFHMWAEKRFRALKNTADDDGFGI